MQYIVEWRLRGELGGRNFVNVLTIIYQHQISLIAVNRVCDIEDRSCPTSAVIERTVSDWITRTQLSVYTMAERHLNICTSIKQIFH